MALIKGNEAAQLIREAIVLDLGDVAHQAAQIRAAAEDKAKRILAEAQVQAQRLTANAHEQGLAEGQAKGYEKGLVEGRAAGRAEAAKQAAEEFGRLQQAWLTAVQQWDEQRHGLEVGSREAVLEFALRLGEKLVHRIIEVDPTVIVDQLSAAMSHVLSPTDLVVRICPQDRPVLEQAMPQLAAEWSHLRHVRLVDDPQVSRGGCLVSYGQGRIDATLDTQLRRIVEVLLPDDGEPAPTNDTPTTDAGPAPSDAPVT